MQVSDIPGNFSAFCELVFPDLKIGSKSPLLNSSGSCLEASDSLKKADNESEICAAAVFSSLGLIPSGPAALSVTKFFSSVFTSAEVTGVNVHSASSLSGPKGSALVRPGW